ncbi:sulfotransferase family protein [Streptomyces sp. CA-111067]|uniref:sulfotransferase family protein n=1 Tax=Streptomyces sp. CA-111067 TaxID=3240046 RepID=UPI003D97450E
MEVIGAGLGRTGTTSLKKALEILGLGPTYHTREIFRDPDRLADWENAVNGGETDWDAVFDGYRSTVDWPAAAFWKELAEHYPDARVILTVRDPQEWYTSCARTIFISYRPGVHWTVLRGLMRIPLMAADKRLRNFRQVFDGVFRRHFGDRPISSREAAVEVFDEHLAAVRAGVPARRLLEYRVTEGWEPLCAFLELPVPEQPFPYENDRRTWQRFTRRQVFRGMRRLALHPGSAGQAARAAQRANSAPPAPAKPAPPANPAQEEPAP